MRKAPSALAYARAFFTADGRNRGLGLGRAQQGRGATRGGARGGGGGSNLLKTSREWICRLQEYNVAPFGLTDMTKHTTQSKDEYLT